MKFRENEEMFTLDNLLENDDEFREGILIKRDAQRVSRAIKIVDNLFRDEGIMGLAYEGSSIEYKAIELVRKFIFEAQKEGKVIF